MARKQRSTENLRDISEGLYFEFFQFHESVLVLGQGLADTRVLNTALLDSFLIHARILFNFFYPPEKPYSTDYIAEDFFTSRTEWTEARPAVVPAFIIDFCYRVSKHIVHLSEARANISLDDQEWGTLSNSAHQYIKDAYQVFMKLVPAENLKGNLLKEKLANYN